MCYLHGTSSCLDNVQNLCGSLKWMSMCEKEEEKRKKFVADAVIVVVLQLTKIDDLATLNVKRP